MNPLEIEDKQATHTRRNTSDYNYGAPLQLEKYQKLPFQELTNRGIKLSKLKAVALRVMLFLPIIYLAIAFYLTSYELYTTNIEVTNEYDSINAILTSLYETNCLKDPILDVQFATREGNAYTCRDGFEHLQSIGTFSGTYPGCYYKEYSQVVKGFCTRYAGTLVWPLDAEYLSNWRGEKFCIKRMDKSQMIIMNSEKDSCPLTHSTRCQRNLLIFCLPSSQKCPISQLKLFHDDYQLETTPNTTMIANADSSLHLVYSSDSNSTAYLVGLTHSLNSLPCLDPRLSPNRTNGSKSYFYPLFIRNESGCQEYGENTDSKILESYSEIEFYQDNYLIGNLSTLPLYKSLTAHQQIALVAQYTTREKNIPNCAICSSLAPFVRTGILIKYEEFYLYYVQFLVLTDIVLFIVLIQSLKRAFNPNRWSNLMNQSIYLHLVWYIFGVLFFTGQYVILNNKFNAKKKLILTVKEIEANDCFINNNLNKLFDNLEGILLYHGSNYTNDSFILQVIGVFALLLVAAAYYVFWEIISSERELARENDSIDTETNSFHVDTYDMSSAKDENTDT